MDPVLLGTSLALAVVLATTASAGARQDPAADSAAAKAQIGLLESWARDPEIQAAVRSSNEAATSLESIQAIDRRWAEGKAVDEMQRLLSNPCALRIKALDRSETFREMLVMDARGALVCMSAPSSDYWQGDEAKWQRSFADGAGEVFVDRARYDASARAVLIQISVPIEENGRAIGVLTAGIDRAQLEP